MCKISLWLDEFYLNYSEDDFHLIPNSIKLSLVGQVPGGRLNKKDGLTRYGDSHVKDKTS